MGGRTYTTHLIPAAFTKPATCGLFFARLFKSETCPGPPPGHYAKRTARREPRCRTVEPGPWSALPGDRHPDRGPRARSPRKKPVSPRSPNREPRAALPGTWAALPGNSPGSPGQSRLFPAIAPGPPARKSRFFQNYYKTRTGADFTQTTGSQNKCL